MTKSIISRFCELCNAKAAVYCPSDSAFLCWTCDSKVHGANFLVARHLRTIICSNCKSFAGDPVVSDLSFPPFLCASCSPDSSHHLDSLSNCSDCDSSSQKKADSDRCRISNSNSLSASGGGVQRRSTIMDWKAEGVLVYWCGKLGLSGDRAVRFGRTALCACWEKMSFLPFRVILAASLWFGLRFSGDRSLRTWQLLKRLEDISGVQAKLILAAESKLERALKVMRSRRQRNQELQEGWAESECSS